MALGLESYLADVDAGFDLLHIDPTKDPHTVGAVVDMDIVLRRTVELIEKIEAYRTEKGLDPLGYEVGTEETNGGLTSTDAFETFIDKLMKQLDEKGLPHPQFIVGQTGTLTRLTENVGKYSFENAQKLGKVTAENAMVLKEHNGDYLADDILLMHPALGVGSSNVAPEFGVEETRAYLELAKLEKKLYDLELTRQISIQTAPQISMIQSNDTMMAEKIQSTIVNTIPLWKNQMVLALGIEDSTKAAKAEAAVTEMTNKLLTSNAEKLKTATIETAKASERGVVDMETLRRTNEMLVSTLDEVARIQSEGREKRAQAELELATLESELKNKLLSMNS